MKKPITISDIAIKLDISKSTVSRALKDHPDVNPETKRRVKALAEKLDYEPNLLASSLAKKQSNLIGVILPEFNRTFFSSALEGIQHVARANGFNVIICQSNEEFENEVLNTKMLASNKVAGILMSLTLQTEDFSHLRKLQDKNIPFVLFDRVADNVDCPKVTVDDFQGAYQVTSHLIKKGYKNIAHLSGPLGLSISKKRYEGFMKALDDHGFDQANAQVYECKLLNEDAYHSARKLLELNKDRPDAIFCVSDYVAFEAMRCIRDLGLRIPEDVALAGFTNDPATNYVTPPLTTMEQPAKLIGEKACELLLQHLKSEEHSEFPHLELPTNLIERGST
ncbi:LacI family DNA-binding transcriptional regulator [Persicobacter diffluens]